MAATHKSDRCQLERDDPGPQDSGFPPDLLTPIIAGAFARGIAETLEMLNVPALLLDRGGLVLNASVSARPFLEGGLTLKAGHLLARAEQDNALLARFMAEVLRAPDDRQSVDLDACRLTLSALPVPGGFAPTDQLLHAILVIGPAGADRSCSTQTHGIGAS